MCVCVCVCACVRARARQHTQTHIRKVKDTHKDKYTIEDYNPEEMEDMKQMPLNIAFGAIFFLQSLGKELTSHSLSYLAKQPQLMTTQQREALTKSMAGGLAFTQLAKAI